MKKDRKDKKLYEWKLISTRLAGRAKGRWENDVKENMRIMNTNISTKRI
jgi:hypothetical protein